MIECLVAAGSQGAEEIAGDILGHVPATSSIDEIRAAILAADAAVGISISPARTVEWTAWRADVRAHRLGSLNVSPPWLAAGSDPARTIVIDPAMAFGTGEHATTRGVIRLMEGVVGADSVVADLGAGSAILSIAAAKLGAARVVAIELDPDAEGNALENIRRNGVENRVHFVGGDAFILLPLVAPVSLVFANIVSSVLLRLLPVIRGSLPAGGRAILAGILTEERQTMLNEIAHGGWRVEAEDTEEGWWSVLIAKP